MTFWRSLALRNELAGPHSIRESTPTGSGASTRVFVKPLRYAWRNETNRVPTKLFFPAREDIQKQTLSRLQESLNVGGQVMWTLFINIVYREYCFARLTEMIRQYAPTH
jgi:hypothetical protein